MLDRQDKTKRHIKIKLGIKATKPISAPNKSEKILALLIINSFILSPL